MNITLTLPGGRTVEGEIVPYTADTLAVYVRENPAWAGQTGRPRYYWHVIHVRTRLEIVRMRSRDDALTMARQLYGRLPASAWLEASDDELDAMIDRELAGGLLWLRTENRS